MPLVPIEDINNTLATSTDMLQPLERETPTPQFEMPEDEPSTGDILKSAFSLNNQIGSFVSKFNNIESNNGRDVDPNYDAWTDLDGYEDYKDRFVFAESKQDVDFIKRNIDDEAQSRKVLENGGVLGFFAELASDLIDPVNMIPMGGGAFKAFQGGGSILKKAGIVGLGGFTGASVQELSLHATQETRTLGESALNVSAATLLTGILGGAAATYEAKQFAKLERDLNIPAPDEPDLFEPNSFVLSKEDLESGTSLSAASVAIPESLNQLKGGLGKKIAEATKWTPNLRLSLSPSVESRKVVQELTETPFIYEKNALGIENPISAWTRIKMYDFNRYEALRSMDEQYTAYRERIAGSFVDRASAKLTNNGTKYLSMKEFREEVGRAMRRGDQAVIPEVQAVAKAYREKLFDPLKNRGIEVGLLPEGVKVTTADSYLTRVYNKNKIASRKPEFKKILTSWLRKQPDIGDDIDAVDSIADDIIGKLLGGSEGRIDYMPISKRGPLKERVLDIPDSQIEDFLESDIEMIGNYYQRTFAPDVELQARFGSIDLKDNIQKVNDDYAKKTNNLDISEKDRLKLDKLRQRDVRDIEGVRDLIRGTYTSNIDPDNAIRRVFTSARRLNFTRLLGGVVASSFPDVARPIFSNGFSMVFKGGIKPFIRNSKKFKLAGEEAKRAGTALDVELNTRLNAMADLNEPYARGTKLERGIEGLSNVAGRVFMISQWNSFSKRFAGNITQSRIFQNALGEVKEETEYMRALGISPAAQRKIAQQFKKYGEREDDLFIANTDKWTDREARETFRAAMSKEIDKTIVTPAPGERPFWMESETGKTIGQFKTFFFAAHQKILVAGLQENEMRFMSGLVTSVGLGMLAYAVKQKAAGYELSDDPQTWILEGLDRSGVVSLFFEANNMTEKLTGYGAARIFGAAPMSRYASRNQVGGLLGPTLGLTEDVRQVIASIGTDNYNKSDTRALRRIIPFQNLIYLRRLFDKMEEGVNETFGVQ
jgi:hypothetical protein